MPRGQALRGPAGVEQVDGKGQSFGLNIWRETCADRVVLATAAGCDSGAFIGQNSAGFS